MTYSGSARIREPLLRNFWFAANFSVLLIGAALSGSLHDLARAPGQLSLTSIGALLLASLMTAHLLHDRQFVGAGRDGCYGTLLAAFALRLASVAVILVTLGSIRPLVENVPRGHLLLWFWLTLSLATAVRLLALRLLRDRASPASPTRQLEPVLVAGTVPVRLLAERPIRNWDAVSKAAFDLLLGGLMTLLLLPLFGFIALTIRLTSSGPVLYRQRRHALDNREFFIFKFRTMRWNPSPTGEALQQTLHNDSRITPVGRFLRASSLDELPQLFNVLTGDMSLVGPRPHAVDMRTANLLGAEITQQYAQRHRVRPGITGWSQVNGARGATHTTEELRRRVELDLNYIDNWSLLLDLKILARTTLVVLRRTNAF